MRLSVHAFWLPKAGNRAEEYEDAFAYSPLPEEALPDFCGAVADGATETSFSGLWAALLTGAFVEGRLDEPHPETLTALAVEWQAEIDARTRGKPLPWYAEEKLQSGAYSSLLGLRLTPEGGWRAISIGDSCLFHFHKARLVQSFPFDDPAQFNNRPALLSTRADRNRGLLTAVAEGTCVPGDCFWLMTDALAHFFLSQYTSLPEWQWAVLRNQFLRLKSQESFSFILSELRQRQVCKNDDVTLLRVRVLKAE
jgi:hypothetical protein